MQSPPSVTRMETLPSIGNISALRSLAGSRRSRPFTLRLTPSLLSPRRVPVPISISHSFRPQRPFAPRAVSCGTDHHHHHGHSHGGKGELSGAQLTVLRFAKAVGWADVADFLREHLQLCCCSMALLLLAAACPFLLPARSVKPAQSALVAVAVAFPLVGNVVTRSFAESEYRAMAHDATELIWMCPFLSELGFPSSGCATLYSDNKSALLLAQESRLCSS